MSVIKQTDTTFVLMLYLYLLSNMPALVDAASVTYRMNLGGYEKSCDPRGCRYTGEMTGEVWHSAMTAQECSDPDWATHSSIRLEYCSTDSECSHNRSWMNFCYLELNPCLDDGCLPDAHCSCAKGNPSVIRFLPTKLNAKYRLAEYKLVDATAKDDMEIVSRSNVVDSSEKSENFTVDVSVTKRRLEQSMNRSWQTRAGTAAILIGSLSAILVRCDQLITEF
ncbi:uncharacterized protein LOC131955873 [Physella acuta]|uniref:uncharacterized protein LOC131955873 n=1 Tax=Physella acuta TaxID=109671 RepID=UPI0027DAEFB6|nr:uncharacterized protein LOC131955873 [Physella acuta]